MYRSSTSAALLPSHTLAKAFITHCLTNTVPSEDMFVVANLKKTLHFTERFTKAYRVKGPSSRWPLFLSLALINATATLW